ncbi:tetratricopeptide repeat protein [Planctomyces sp. SH-PL62]|uniref:tetratricopeptide repeat protein n=1 Tax=Planctomyces sp. SH-PL62 TaxID=1636152 RepID=UPI00078BF3AF|nr:hypothetical protein [Planctomyces sp. SH-PL62]AMV39760.1 hypothetical protein VT85_20170 [Planctomyces sp. SH-PL62]
MSEGRLSPPKPRSSALAEHAREAAATAWGLRLFDAVLIGFFLALGFLLGVFRLKDTDFYWHLRTGDLIRKWGEIPRVDFYTFTRAGSPWIDLHWIFQVCISWVHEQGGVPALTLAKCLVTCAALLLLITARRRTWPVWAMVLAWLPALLVLSGRMYIRPETLTLLYLSIFLAVLCRWDRRPWLAWVLPFAQVAWVNSHGLFILGPIILGFALIDAALRRGSLAVERRRWWSTVVPASAATGLACLLNPYGLHGALYPLELAGTMRGADFSRTIAELKPIPQFIQESGFGNVPLQIHMATIVLGALSFLLPILDAGASRLQGLRAGSGPAAEPAPDGRKRKRAKGADAASRKGGETRRKKASEAAIEAAEPGWRISLLRLLLFASFSILSFQATRNSHQFAAVVGTVTAWNFAEWAAARHARREAAGVDDGRSDGIRPRLVALVALIFLTFAVGSGLFYTWAGEGRVIGWGEEPLWFPHESAKFAGEPDMPDRFLSFHNGHASLFIYYHSPEKPGGPGKTVFTDPRLEVTGPQLYRRYLDLKEWIAKDNPRWQRELDAEGRPSILVDHEYNTETGAALLKSGRWRCVRFDTVSAVFVHESYEEAVAAHEVDFAARHFHPSTDVEPQGEAALIAASKGMRNYANFLGAGGRGDLARPMLWLALDYAWRVVKAEPDSLEGWKSIGYVEMIRDPTAAAPRCRMPFDPIFDLSTSRATYALRRASAIAPRDFLTLAVLQRSYENRGMLEPLLATLDRIRELRPINPQQTEVQAAAELARGPIAQRLSEPVPTRWGNLDELDRLVNHELELGRVETAARLLENAYPVGKGGWDAVERLSTLLLHLGEPGRAREYLQSAGDVPRPAVRDARLAVCDVVEGRFDRAREHYLRAIAADPKLFEARYGLAVLEQDDARADEAYEQAMAAVGCAPNDTARSVAQAVASSVRRYAVRDRAE